MSLTNQDSPETLTTITELEEMVAVANQQQPPQPEEKKTEQQQVQKTPLADRLKFLFFMLALFLPLVVVSLLIYTLYDRWCNYRLDRRRLRTKRMFVKAMAYNFKKDDKSKAGSGGARPDQHFESAKLSTNTNEILAPGKQK